MAGRPVRTAAFRLTTNTEIHVILDTCRDFSIKNDHSNYTIKIRVHTVTGETAHTSGGKTHDTKGL